MADRTVDLVIRAKNEATAVLQQITASLDSFSQAQSGVASKAEGTGSALDKLVTGLSSVSKGIQNLKDFGKVQADMQKLGETAEKLGQDAGKASIEANRLAAALGAVEARQSAAVTRTNAASAAVKAQSAAVAEDTRALKSLDGQIASTAAAIGKLDAISQGGKRLTGSQQDTRTDLERRQRALENLRDNAAGRQSQSTAALGPLQGEQRDAGEQAAAVAAQLASLRKEALAADTAANALAGKMANVVRESQELATAAAAVGQRLGVDATNTAAYSEALAKLEGAQTRVNLAMQRNADIQRVKPADIRGFQQNLANGEFGAAGPQIRDQQQAVEQARRQQEIANDRATQASRQQAQQPSPTNALAATASRVDLDTAERATAQEVETLARLKAALSETLNARRADAEAARAEVAAEREAAAAAAAETAAKERSIAAKRESSEAAKAEAAAAKAAAAAEREKAAAEREAASAAAAQVSALAGQEARIFSLIGAYVGLQQAAGQVKAAFEAATSYEAAQVRVTQALGGTNEQGAAAFQHIVDEATRLKVPVLESADSFGKFIAAVKGTAIEGDKAAHIFDSFLTISRGFKLDSESIQRGTIALRDLAASGQITLRYLNQFDRAVPVGLLSEMAKAAGFGAGEIGKFLEAVHKGQIGLDVLAPALDAVANRVSKNLPAALQTSQSTLVDFQNAFLQAQLSFTSGGFLDAVVTALNEVNTALRSDEGRAGLRETGAIIGQVITILASLATHAKIALQVIGAIGAVKLVSFLAGTEGIIATFTGITATLEATRAAKLAQVAVDAELVAAEAEVNAAFLSFAAAGGSAKAAAAGIIAADESIIAVEGETAAATLGLGEAFAALALSPAGIAIGLAAVVAGAIAFASGSSQASHAGDDFNRVLADMKLQGDAAASGIRGANEAMLKLAGDHLDAAILSQRDAMKELTAEVLRFSDAQRQSKIGNFFTGQDNGDLNRVQDFAQGLASGKVSVDDFQSEYDKLKESLTDPKAIDNLVREKKALDDFVDGTKKLAGLSQAGEAGKSKIAGLADDAAKSKGALDQMKSGLAGAAEGLTKGQEAAANLSKALEEVTKRYPELAKEAKAAADAVADQRYLDAARAADNAEGAGSGPKSVYGGTQNFDRASANLNAGEQAKLQAALQKVPGYTAQQDALINRITRFESGGGLQASPSGSKDPQQNGAFGPGQFLKSTFQEQFTKTFGDTGLGNNQIAALRQDPEVVKAVQRTFLQGIQADLRNFQNANDETKGYLGYNIGTGNARAVLGGNPNAKVRDTIESSAYNGNKKLYGDLTNQQALEKINGLVGGGQKLDAKGYTKGEATDADITKIVDKTLSDLKSKQGAAGTGATVDKRAEAVASAQQKTSDEILSAVNKGNEGTPVTKLNKDQQAKVNDVGKQAGATYDATHKDEAEKASLEELETLEKRRATAIEEVNNAQKKGDTKSVDEYKAKVKELTDEILKAIPAAKKMVDALGDTKGVAKLEDLHAKLGEVKDKTDEVGKTIANDFAGDAMSGIETFFDEISKGKKGIDALKDAFLKFASSFLKQIAEMILKKALLGAIGGNPDSKGSAQSGGIFSGLGSAIGGGGGGGGFGSIFGALFHEGGMIGGTPLMTRAVNPMWFANAPRFHDGGFPGLAPSEVPIIAQKGEQVLSRTQVANGQKTAGTEQPKPMRNILVMGDDQVAAAMAGSHGEQVMMSHIKRNASTISKMVK